MQLQFHWQLLDEGVRHRYMGRAARTSTGRQSAFIEIDDQQFYQEFEGVVFDS